MFGVNNPVFLENAAAIKEELDVDNYRSNKVFISETTINTNTMELNDYGKDDKIKLDLITTDFKLELSPPNANLHSSIINDEIKIEHVVVDDLKVEFNDKQLFCNNCNEYYEEYCAKCGMLISILNGIDKETRKEIPTDILEIQEDLLGNTGVFALKTIPRGVRFGPFSGFSAADSSWRLKGGKFLMGNNKTESLNWMQYVNSARNNSDQNLYAFLYEDNLFYGSVCEIRKGEELFVYFGEYKEGLNDDIEIDFIPTIEKDVENVFACTYCCLGFSLKEYLLEHKTVCRNGTNGNFEGMKSRSIF